VVVHVNSVGIMERADNNIDVYPTIANDRLFVSQNAPLCSYSELTFILTDLLGRELKRGYLNGENKHEIDIRTLENSSYILRIEGEGIAESFRFQVSR
jgi:hypothetical protein